jgi:hypothetical protein
MRWEPYPTMAIEEIALSIGRWGTEANQTLDGASAVAKLPQAMIVTTGRARKDLAETTSATVSCWLSLPKS